VRLYTRTTGPTAFYGFLTDHISRRRTTSRAPFVLSNKLANLHACTHATGRAEPSRSSHRTLPVRSFVGRPRARVRVRRAGGVVDLAFSGICCAFLSFFFFFLFFFFFPYSGIRGACVEFVSGGKRRFTFVTTMMVITAEENSRKDSSRLAFHSSRRRIARHTLDTHITRVVPLDSPRGGKILHPRVYEYTISQIDFSSPLISRRG